MVTGIKKAIKCCPKCQDYKHCADKGNCCEYCDYYVNTKCTYGTKKAVTAALDGSIEFTDYRGDDFGIDDYEAYEDIDS